MAEIKRIKVKWESFGVGCLVQVLGMILAIIIALAIPVVGIVLGIIVFIVLAIVGRQLSRKFYCPECNNRLDNSKVQVCPVCKSRLKPASWLQL
ncbi:MAG: hypothetical protein ACTSQ8_12700 [Candidatus Helarchaeota archaeon]